MDNEQLTTLKDIEKTIGRSIRRDISRMVAFAEGNLADAARSILSHAKPHVAIVTGFYIEYADPPSPETDGLGGAAHIAAALASAGIEVTIITDAPCAKAVWAVVDAIPEKVNLEVVAVSEQAVRGLRDRLASGNTPLTHLIAIERVSPGSDGKPHREHGWDMSRQTAPLHLLFEELGWQRSWETIGIGDGGNEIGMGNLPKDIVTADIPNGSLIAASTRTDHLIVAGVSTWGGYGLVAGLAALDAARREQLCRHFTREFDHNILRAATEVGQAIDDSRLDKKGQVSMSVDRLEWEEHALIIDALRMIVT